MPTLRLPLLLPGLLALLVTAALATPVQYLETFETTAARDATATTALWDTVAHELRIESIPMTVVGGWDSPGGVLSLAVAGNHAFLADGVEGLHIVDITDPANPSLVATFNTPGSANDVAIAGNYAFVADNTSGLRVIDITNPAAPVAAGAYDTPGSAYQVVIAGNYAYVADGSAGLRVVNISNPASPVSAGTYDTTEARDLVVAGDNVYVADGSAGLRVISVANPASPVLRATLDTPGTASGVATWGDYLFLADGTAGIQMISIVDPALPVLVRTVDTPGTARNVAVDGNWVYLADVNSQVRLFEISASGSLYERENCSIPGIAYNLVTAGGHAYVAAYSAGLQVLRISASCPPEPGVTAALTSIPLRIALDGPNAYVANGANGLRVLSLAYPDSPYITDTLDTGNANGLDLEGDYAYVSDGTSGLKIIDISNQWDLELAGSYPATGTFYDVTVDGDYAYVANQSLGVRVLNVSNPTAPTLAGTFATIGWAWTVAVDGDLAYVAEYDAGVRVLNVTNPAAPVSIGLCNTPGAVTDVAVHGDYVYAADGTSGLQVIDVRNPASPYIVGACNTPGTARNVALAGDVAYVADGIGGIQIIDISDPANPVIVDAYNTDDSVYDVAVAGNYAYVASSTTGIQAFAIRERILATRRNRAQSLSLNQPGEDLLKVKLSTVQAGSGSISWQLNAVDPDGSPWQAISPGSGWVTLAQTGDRLTWGCTFDWDANYVSPVCTQIAISWLAAPALIASVSDIPGDQGGRVRLAFARSAFDFADEPGAPITGYNVWRRVDDAQLKAALAGAEPGVADATGDLSLRRLHERSFHVADPTVKSAGGPTGLVTTGAFPAGIWESMGTVLPVQQDQYLVPVATLADSAATIPWAVYCITAHTAMPSVWYTSPPDSGWSVDNLAPAVPAGLHREPGDVLAWLASPAADFQYFSVYGSAADHLDGSETLLEHTTGTSAEIDGSTYPHYLVTATDCHGNESEAAALDAMSAVPGAIPSTLRLYPCQPNPFNPQTTIRFDLPTSGPVRVSVFDIAGRLIRTLVDQKMPQGRHEAVWDGRDASGRDVGSGTYLARLNFEGRVETVRMGLVR